MAMTAAKNRRVGIHGVDVFVGAAGATCSGAVFSGCVSGM